MPRPDDFCEADVWTGPERTFGPRGVSEDDDLTPGRGDCVAFGAPGESPGRAAGLLILFHSCVGTWRVSRRRACRAHITCATGNRDPPCPPLARCPPGRIYGAASSHLLESLAAPAAAALVLKSTTWTEEGGTLNLI